ncbi:MAG: hypothetical protein CVT49_12890 [candidate division Zixibacteria bacterium HGW-Zixibacteria-1]|nr:MAG: hypothetical protein CVT49_12890 [candidate division Zixibacteria bacterium HGW-Zixibacteria-1]
MLTNKSSAIVLKLIKELKRFGSWCGETHVQKTMYFLQEGIGVNTDFDFILYKHGPFSFNLSDLLVSLQSNDVVKLIPQQYPYGPSFALTEDGESLLEEYSDKLGDDGSKIEQIALKLGNKKVVELERLGTALYVSKKMDSDNSIDLKADEIVRLKPHISRPSAILALNEVCEILTT